MSNALLPGRTVLDAVLPCSPRAFERLFVADGAALGLLAFHSTLGDRTVRDAPWAAAPDGARARTLDLMKRMKPNPMLPKEAPVVKAQRAAWRPVGGAEALIVETRSTTKNVPYCDYFVSNETLVVADAQADVPGMPRRSGAATPAAGSCRVLVSIAVAFSKSTVFASRITSETEDAVRAFYEGYVTAMRRVVKSAAAAPVMAVGAEETTGVGATVGAGAGADAALPLPLFAVPMRPAQPSVPAWHGLCSLFRSSTKHYAICATAEGGSAWVLTPWACAVAQEKVKALGLPRLGGSKRAAA